MRIIQTKKDIVVALLIGTVSFAFLQLKYWLGDVFGWGSHNPIYSTVFDLVFLAILITLVLHFMRERRIRRYARLTLPQVDKMDGLDFEHYVCALLEQQGYRARVTRSSGDLGVDVVARKGRDKYAVQVKRYTKNVSRHAVSDAVAGKFHYHCNKAMVVTNRDYTKGARDLAKSTGCVLVDRKTLGKWMNDLHSNKGRMRRAAAKIVFLLAIMAVAVLIRLYIFIAM